MAIGWDTYDKGDYDIYVREYDNAGKAGEARTVANSADYEVRPAVAYDKQGSLLDRLGAERPQLGQGLERSGPVRKS